MDVEVNKDAAPLLGAQSHFSAGKQPGGWFNALADKLFTWLERPVHGSTLCLMRALYSLIMLMQFLKWWHIFDDFEVTFVRTKAVDPAAASVDRFGGWI